MYHFLFELRSRVALIAELAPFGLEQVIGLRRVGIMAERALSSSLQGCVNMCLVHPDLFFGMACVADLVPDILENELGDNAVAEVAILAFLFFYDRVHIFHRKVLLCKLGMAIKTVLPHKRLFFYSGLAREQKDHARQNKEHSRQSVSMVSHG
jgi:hypothetical protein